MLTVGCSALPMRHITTPMMRIIRRLMDHAIA